MALLAGGRASAAEPPADGRAPAPVAAPAPETDAAAGGVAPLLVRIESVSPTLGEPEFLAALFRTLRRPLVSASSGAPPGDAELSIRYDAPRRELVVTCYDKSRGAITRVVEPPDDAREVPETAALLAENLCTTQVDTPQPVAPAPAPVEVFPVAMPPLAPAPPPPPPHEPVVAGIFYPLATNYEKPGVRANFAFNLFYGRVGELDGAGLGMVNAVEADAGGFVAGLLGNRAEGRASGLHAAGLFNSARLLDEGVMLALLLNHANEDVRGGQAALGLNLAGPVRGAQVGGLMNVSWGLVEGAQLAGGGNVARDFQGFQAASVVNVARDLDGVQLGLVNVGARVRGAQVGLVNVADDVDGVPLGLVNVTRSGGVHALAWGGYTTFANAGLKFSTQYTYSMFTLGYHREHEVNAFGPGFVLGVRVPVESGISVAFDVGGDYLFGTRFCCYEDKTAERVAHTKDRNHYRLRVLPTWQVKPRFALFAGAGVALEVPFARYSNLEGYDQSVRLVPDFAAGIEL